MTRLPNDPTRSYDRFTVDDLRRLGSIARADREEFFERNPRYRRLADLVLAVALCQGAGLHYVNGTSGIKDIDVWTFYASDPDLVYPPRRPTASRDFGDPKFGRTVDSPHFVGRRVDCVGRSLAVRKGSDPVAALREYLAHPQTGTASKLATIGNIRAGPG